MLGPLFLVLPLHVHPVSVPEGGREKKKDDRDQRRGVQSQRFRLRGDPLVESSRSEMDAQGAGTAQRRRLATRVRQDGEGICWRFAAASRVVRESDSWGTCAMKPGTVHGGVRQCVGGENVSVPV